MLPLPYRIGSPLRGYVARLLRQERARAEQSHDDRQAIQKADNRPCFDPLEPRLLLSATPGPLPLPTAEALRGDDLPIVNVSSPLVQREGIASVKWGDQYVDAAEYEWLVKFSDDARQDDASLTSLAESLSPYTEVRNLTADGFGVLTAPHVNLKGWQLKRWARSKGGIAYIEPNFIGSLDQTPNDPDFNGQWDFNTINAPLAWDSTTGSSDVVIAVLDSGIDLNHPDLAPNIWRNSAEVPNDGIDNDANGFIDDISGWDFFNDNASPMDDNGHGTHVAGTIGAVGNNNLGVAGVNWDVKLMPIKVTDSKGVLNLIGVVEAIDYVTVMKKDFGVNVAAINASWGRPTPPQGLEDIIAESGDAGILFVTAAGNEKKDIDLEGGQWPALSTLDNIIVVASTDINDNLAVGFGSGSNFGFTSVDLAAPGVGILSTSLYSGFTAMSGTSMAAPHVTGAVGLLASLSRNATASQIKDAILGGVDIIPTLSGKVATGGRLNINQAMLDLQSVSSGPGIESISIGTTSLPQSQLTVTFTEDIDAATVTPSNFLLRERGIDNTFDTGDDVTISISQGDLSQPTPNKVQIDFIGDLAAGTYRLTLVGSGATPIRNLSNDPLNGGTDRNEWFGIQVPVGPNESNDSLVIATDTGLNGVGTASFSGVIGDGIWNVGDVDLFVLQANAGETIIVDIDAQSISSGLDAVVRLFDATGTQVVLNDDLDDLDSYLEYVPATAGNFYVGVSGFGNSAYDPASAGTGLNQSLGDYDLDITIAAPPVSSAEIRGKVWHDLDGLGSIDAGERGLFRSTVFLDLDEDGVLDAGEPSVLTDENGDFVFRDVAPMAPDYIVASELLPGWQWTLTPESVQVGPGTIHTGINFGTNRLAGTITVDSLSDKDNADYSAGDLSLREALDLARLYAPDDTIQFDAGLNGQTILLNTGLGALTVDSNVDIQGPSAAQLTIDAALQSGVFNVTSDATASISGLTVTGGQQARGGGIFNEGGALTLTDMVVDGNQSRTGGGIANFPGGTLDLVDSIVSNNKGLEFGGGVFNWGDMTVSRSSIDGNTSSRHGGGITNFVGTITISDSVVINNSNTSGAGGIDNLAGGLSVISNSTISGNTGNNAGGVLNSEPDSSVVITNATVTNNSSASLSFAGGLTNLTGSTITVHNTIVAGNTARIGSQSPDVSGTFSLASSHNLIGAIDGSTNLDGNNSIFGTKASPLNPLLGSLADNGGPTKTHALLTGSQAVDGGSDAQASAAGLTTDQRGAGFARVVDRSFDGGDAVDIGAFEATDYVVSTILDENDTDFTVGDLSLREALGLAAANAGADVITYAPGLTGTMFLDMGPVAINDSSSVSVVGPGTGLLTLTGNSDFRTLEVLAGTTASISGLTVFEGMAGDGGSIHNAGALTLSGVDVIQGAATRGAGIFNAGTLVVQDGSSISGNFAFGNGGGIYNAGTATVTDSSVSGNAGGGGIHNAGTLAVSDSQINSNTGAGIASPVGSSVITASTLDGNTTGVSVGSSSGTSTATLDLAGSTVSNSTGDGIWSFTDGIQTIKNVTISGNAGAGILSISGGSTIVNSTITNNNTGINANFGTPPMILHNTIVWGNTGSYDVRGLFDATSSSNLLGMFGGPTIGLDDPSNITGIDPLLGALADNGGTTMTHALLIGSQAVDGGSDARASAVGLTTDQRGTGFTRVVDRSFDGGNAVDIGAFETTEYAVSTALDEDDTDFSPGDLSLREALALTAANPGVDVIGFAPVLSGGYAELIAPMVIDSDVNILGPEGASFTFDANGSFGAFEVTGGRRVTISNLTITGGEATPSTNGSGIVNRGSLTLTGVTVTGNRAVLGGGIYNTDRLTIQGGTTISGNQASSDGGGIYSVFFTSIKDGSTISANTSATFGGGIYNRSNGVLSILDSSILDNTALTGGGLRNNGDMEILRSTIDGNFASSSGGIDNTSTAVMDLINSAVTNNSANGAGGIGIAGEAAIINTTISGNSASGSVGGVLQSPGSSLDIISSTITDNRADSDGVGGGEIGGISSNGSTRLFSTIVAKNFIGTGSAPDDVFGTFVRSGSHNLIGAIDGSTNLDNVNSIFGTKASPLDPLLGALADNGGTTKTHALLAGSVAIDAGNNSLASIAGLWDQRGDPFSRLIDGDSDTIVVIDIGAYEFQA